MRNKSASVFLVLVGFSLLALPFVAGAYLINKDVYQSFADPQDNFEVVLKGDWRDAETDPDKVISPFEGENVNISYDAAKDQTTVSFFGPELPQNLDYQYHFGFGYGISRDHGKIIREYWTRAEEGSDVPGGSFGYIYNQATGTVEVLVSNDTYYPTILSEVGFLILDEELPLELMDRENYPPEAFEPSGIPDGTILEPGEMLTFTIEGVTPDNAIMTYQTVEFSQATAYQLDVGEWVQVSIAEDILNSTLGVKGQVSEQPEALLRVSSHADHAEIRYTVPHRGHVSLHVYTVAGEKVSVLVDETVPAGDNILEWDGDDLPSGLYIVRLTTDGIQVAEKMIHLK